ncbi:MAG: hypothetical protein JNL95_04020, partial [Chitinophagales bacterium]|nr:hypothetical protein [Chitinophagales bacterium]
MKKTTLLSSIIIAITSILLSANSNAQTLVNQEWVTTGANPNYHFQYFNAASNNGYLYLVGNSYHTAQQENFIIGKMDDQGNWLWFREYNSISNYKDFGIDIFAKDSFIYVTGISWDSVSNNSEIVTMRIDDSTGNILWSQTWGSRYNVAVKVIADNAGNIYVGGTAQTAVSEFGMVVLKYKPTGSFEWESIYDSTGIMEGAVTMLLDSPQTNITITGYSGNTTNNWNFATIEMDAASGSIKTSTITNNGSGGFSSPVGISKDHNDATFIAGTVANPTTGKAQMKLIAYDDQWNVNFIRIWGDSTTSTEAADYHFDFNGGKTLLGNHTRSNGTKEIVLVRYESDPAQFMWART